MMGPSKDLNSRTFLDIMLCGLSPGQFQSDIFDSDHLHSVSDGPMKRIFIILDFGTPPLRSLPKWT